MQAFAEDRVLHLSLLTQSSCLIQTEQQIIKIGHLFLELGLEVTGQLTYKLPKLLFQYHVWQQEKCNSSQHKAIQDMTYFARVA